MGNPKLGDLLRAEYKRTGTSVKIYCCGCESYVSAKLTNGKEIYPHRDDLKDLPFWKCEACGNYVGCHHKTKDRTRPLGVIPTPELRSLRSQIHRLIDPLWREQNNWSRRQVYKRMAKELGLAVFHSAELKSLLDAERALIAAKKIVAEDTAAFMKELELGNNNKR